MTSSVLAADVPKYLALFDILGFKETARNTPVSEAIARFGPESRFWKDVRDTVANIHVAPVPSVIPIPNHQRQARCSIIRFSDTFLIWSDDHTERGFAGVLWSAAAVLTQSLAYGIPLRGAITHGELYVSADRSFFFGEGLIRAYELEQAQEWSGALLDDERIDTNRLSMVFAKAVASTLLIPYSPPLKQGQVRTMNCVNWPAFYSAIKDNDVSEVFKKWRGTTPPQWPHERKVQETIRFQQYVDSRAGKK